MIKLWLRFIGNQDTFYSVTAWIGHDASQADLAALDGIVGSVSFDDVPERYNACDRLNSSG